MTEEKKTEDGAGITAGRDVVFSDVNQMAIGKKITQTQTISSFDKKELQESLEQFKEEIANLKLPPEEATMVNGDVTSAIKEAKKDKLDLAKIKSRVEGALETIKEVGDTIEKVSKWESTKKILKFLAKVGKGILL